MVILSITNQFLPDIQSIQSCFRPLVIYNRLGQEKSKINLITYAHI